jgi:hypothetical protein
MERQPRRLSERSRVVAPFATTRAFGSLLVKLRSRSAYFCATNSRALLNSGRVEFDPSQTFSNSA